MDAHATKIQGKFHVGDCCGADQTYLRNRYFSLSTLPPRPEFTDINVRDQSLQTDPQPTETHSTKIQDGATSVGGVDVVDTKQPNAGLAALNGHEPQPSLSTENDRTITEETSGRQDAKALGQEVVGESRVDQDGEDKMELDVSPPSVLESAKIKQLRSPRGSPGVDATRATSDGKERAVHRPGLSIPSPRKPLEDTVMADIHSSPASSHDAPSSNQEAAIGSPTTSPGEDVGSAVERIDADLVTATSATESKGNAERAMHVESQPQPSSAQRQTHQVPKVSQLDTVSVPESPSKRIRAESPLTVTPTANYRRGPMPVSTMPSPLERMTTRVSSGALRHKSVSEILGETPKPPSPSQEKQPGDKTSAESSRAPSVAVSVSSPSGRKTPENVIQARQAERREKDKERSRLSTVVFPKQQAAEKV